MSAAPVEAAEMMRKREAGVAIGHLNSSLSNMEEGFPGYSPILPRIQGAMQENLQRQQPTDTCLLEVGKPDRQLFMTVNERRVGLNKDVAAAIAATGRIDNSHLPYINLLHTGLKQTIVAMLRESTGKPFDPLLLDDFTAAFDAIHSLWRNSGDTGLVNLAAQAETVIKRVKIMALGETIPEAKPAETPAGGENDALQQRVTDQVNLIARQQKEINELQTALREGEKTPGTLRDLSSALVRALNAKLASKLPEEKLISSEIVAEQQQLVALALEYALKGSTNIARTLLSGKNICQSKSYDEYSGKYDWALSPFADIDALYYKDVCGRLAQIAKSRGITEPAKINAYFKDVIYNNGIGHEIVRGYPWIGNDAFENYYRSIVEGFAPLLDRIEEARVQAGEEALTTLVEGGQKMVDAAILQGRIATLEEQLTTAQVETEAQRQRAYAAEAKADQATQLEETIRTKAGELAKMQRQLAELTENGRPEDQDAIAKLRRDLEGEQNGRRMTDNALQAQVTENTQLQEMVHALETELTQLKQSGRPEDAAKIQELEAKLQAAQEETTRLKEAQQATVPAEAGKGSPATFTIPEALKSILLKESTREGLTGAVGEIIKLMDNPPVSGEAAAIWKSLLTCRPEQVGIVLTRLIGEIAPNLKKVAEEALLTGWQSLEQGGRIHTLRYILESLQKELIKGNLNVVETPDF